MPVGLHIFPQYGRIIVINKRQCRMQEIWNRLYNEAKRALNPRKVSDMVEAGGVAAAIEAGSGKIYVGVCVDTSCTLGICAERNAIFNMITNGESVIKRVVTICGDGKAGPPCGACRELMTQIMPHDYKGMYLDVKTKPEAYKQALGL